MSGRPKTYSVKLTEAETVKLEQLVAARKSPQSLAKRAKVTLCCAAHPDWSDAQVASSIGGSVAWVRKWRKRLCSKRHSPRSPPEWSPAKVSAQCESRGDSDRLHSTE